MKQRYFTVKVYAGFSMIAEFGGVDSEDKARVQATHLLGLPFADFSTVTITQYDKIENGTGNGDRWTSYEIEVYPRTDGRK